MEDLYLSTLKQYWGYNDFRGIQREIIESIGKGRDTLGLMPTGGGKSITFQVPALTMEGTCIVFTPLIALMKDQVDALLKRGIRAAAIHSGLSHSEVVKTLDTAVFGGIRILYIAPERLNSELFITKIKKIKVSFITVDEAHCICYWGYDFRPSYLQIAKIRSLKPGVPVLALTASATPDAVKDIQYRLEFKEENVFRMSFERKNLHYRIVHSSLRERTMLRYLDDIQGSCIIYIRNRENCHNLCNYLNEKGYKATYYHAGLADSIKNERQNHWKAGEYRIMVATNAFGMGIDKPDVRLVMHMDLPDSIEAYYQEAGRAGRDGETSYAIIPMDGKELQQFRKRVKQTYPEEEYIRDIYQKLGSYFQMAVGDGLNVTREFNLEEFCRLFHTQRATTQSALHILQNAGYINYADEDESCSRLKIIATRHELYQTIDKDKEPIFNCLLRNYCGIFVEYCYIEEALLSSQTNLSQDYIYQTLKLLSKAQIVSYIPRKRISRITFLQRRVDKERLIFPKEVYKERKKKYLMRINAMEEYCTSQEECRSRMLLNYFGETQTKDCGQCDVCQANMPLKISKAEHKQLRHEIIRQFQNGPLRVFDLKVEGLRTEKLQIILNEMRENEELELDGITLKLKENITE